MPIIFIYRDNDLFRENMPEIINNLQAWGRKVEMQVFPQGMDKKEIKKWTEENKDKLTKKEVVTDQTVKYQMDYNYRNKSKEQGTIIFNQTLDNLFDTVSRGAILGDDIQDVEKSIEEINREIEQLKEGDSRYKRGRNQIREKELFLAEKGVNKIIKKILEKAENMPSRVQIPSSCICDHPPFQAKDPTDKHIQKAAKILLKWLVDAGIPENVVSIQNSLVGIKDLNPVKYVFLTGRKIREHGSSQIVIILIKIKPNIVRMAMYFISVTEGKV